MHVALNQILAKLPGDTKTYVGHEYTASKSVILLQCLSLGRS